MLKNKKIWNFLIWLSILCIPLGNLTVINVSGLEFKIMHVFAVVAIFFAIPRGKVNNKHLAVGMFFILLPIIQVFYINDIGEWIKTYVIYVLIIMFLLLALEHYMSYFCSNMSKNISCLLNVILITQILGILQFILMNVFGVFWLDNVFGRFQYASNQYEIAYGFYRAYSLFLEPSFFGWVCNIGLSISLICLEKRIISKKRGMIYIIFDIVAVLTTLSTSALIFTVCIFIFYQMISKRITKQRILCFLGVLLGIFIVSREIDIFAPFIKLSAINNVGSSGYQRTFGALEYVKATMKHYPLFGRGLGQEGTIDIIGVIGKQAAVHNSWLGLVSVFGLSSISFLFLGANVAYKMILRDKLYLLLVIAIVGMYASTGSFISFDTFIYVILISAVGYSIMKKESRLI